ncbi:MAG: CBS domain-containing protein [Candidatus Bipolaricaulota bacterium]|nr:MAG: CBS domain-containing protein [Candidatus Bipolaricaulota bacterium]
MDVRYAKTQELLYELKIAEVMRRELNTFSPVMTMSELRDILRDHRISGVPVLEGEELVGIVSIEDLIRWLSAGGEDCAIAAEMTKKPECLYADQPLVHAIKRFDESGFGRFPVIDRATGKLAGILTKGKLMEGVLRKLESEIEEEELRRYRASHIFEDITADYKEIYLTYDVPGKDFDRAGSASTGMKRNLKRLGIHPDIIHRLAIASYEAEMNLVIYTDGGVMEFHISPQEVFLRVKDNGPGIEDIEKAMQTGYSTAAHWVRELGFGAGMGLSNINKCADKMEIDSTPGIGTTLKIRMFTGPQHKPDGGA